MRNKVNIGTASIILIFIILCLSVFSLLSLSDAKSSEVFARRRADSVTAYYRADAEGQLFVKTVSESLKNGRDVSSFSDGNGRLIREIPMSSGQSLRIELDERDASVLSYYVYNSEDYAIDNSLPVWTGD